jgi:hypothetical protein
MDDLEDCLRARRRSSYIESERMLPEDMLSEGIPAAPMEPEPAPMPLDPMEPAPEPMEPEPEGMPPPDDIPPEPIPPDPIPPVWARAGTARSAAAAAAKQAIFRMGEFLFPWCPVRTGLGFERPSPWKGCPPTPCRDPAGRMH